MKWFLKSNAKTSKEMVGIVIRTKWSSLFPPSLTDLYIYICTSGSSSTKGQEQEALPQVCTGQAHGEERTQTEGQIQFLYISGPRVQREPMPLPSPSCSFPFFLHFRAMFPGPPQFWHPTTVTSEGIYNWQEHNTKVSCFFLVFVLFLFSQLRSKIETQKGLLQCIFDICDSFYNVKLHLIFARGGIEGGLVFFVATKHSGNQLRSFLWKQAQNGNHLHSSELPVFQGFNFRQQRSQRIATITANQMFQWQISVSMLQWFNLYFTRNHTRLWVPYGAPCGLWDAVEICG